MKKAKTKISLSKEAWGRTKNTFARKSLVLALFSFFILLSLGIALFLPESLILTIPLLVIPSVFAYQSINTILATPLNNDVPGFFVMFKLYFSKFFFGTYKTLKALGKAILVSLILYLASSIIFSFSVPSFGEELMKVMQSQDESLLMDFINNNELFQKYLLISETSIFIVSAMMFVHTISVESTKLYMNLFSKTPLLAVDLNTVHKSAFKEIKKEFYKEYYKALWFIPILMVLGYCLASFLGIMFLDLESERLIVLGLFGSFVLTFMFVPYYFDVMMILFSRYQNVYTEHFIKLSFETLEQLKKTNKINAEKEKEITDFLNKSKEHSEKDKK